jgi:hypothetical protein
MAAKLAALFITLICNVVIGVVVFFLMLIAMNGFNESDAEKGLIAYVTFALIVTLAMTAGAYLLTAHLLRRDLSGAVAALIAVPVFTVVGGGLKLLGSVIGIAVAEYVRVNY